MPPDNVATFGKGAVVIKNEKTEMANREIIIQLGQPYYIGSVRIPFWEAGKATPQFYIETSVDMQIWNIAVDRRIENVDLSPVFHFIPRLTVFVRINAAFANEVKIEL